MSIFSRAAQITREWAHGRKPDRFIVVRVDKVAPDDGGLFGIGKSPSIAGSHPDPHKIEGEVVWGKGPDDASRVAVVVPGAEGRTIASGDRLAMGMLGPATTICILKAPADLPGTGFEAWVRTVECKP